MKKLLSILLAALMVATLGVVNVTAEGEEETGVNQPETLAEKGLEGSGTSKENNATETIESKEISDTQWLKSQVENGGEITLQNNLSIDETIVITKDVVLDLNGYSLTSNGTTILNNGSLIIKDTSESKDGKVISLKHVAVAVGDNSTTTIENGIFESVEGAVITGYAQGATINIKGGTFSASDNAVIAGNGNETNKAGEVRTKKNVISISDGTFNGNIKSNGYIACGIYAPWIDEINVQGGTFNINGGAGIVARAGSVNISGGTFNITKAASDGWVGDNKNLLPSSTLVYDKKANYPAQTENDMITVTGGTFNGSDAASVLLKDESVASRIVISGGAFSVKPDSKYLASGKEIYKDANGYYVSDKIYVTYGTEGLSIKFPTSNYVDSLIKGIEIGDNVVYSGFYDKIEMKSTDDYKIYGSISNGKFFDDSFSYIEKVDNNTVKISSENLKKLGFVQGQEYEIELFDNTNYKTLVLGKVLFDSGLNEIDHSRDRVQKLDITIAAEDLEIVVGKKIPSSIKATIKDENGNEVKNAKVVWARESSVTLGSNEKILVNAIYDYYIQDGEFGLNDVEFFDASSEYFLVVDYYVNNKNYADNFEIYINGEKVAYNGKTLSGFGAGGGLAYCFVDITDEYSYSKSYGYAKPSITISNSVTATEEEKATYNNKIVGMFDNSTSEGQPKTYANNANKASENTSITNAGCNEIVVTFVSATAEKQNSNIVATTMTFDVTPVKADQTAVHGKVSNKITFRLPVDPQADYKYADVYHEGVKIGQYEVKTDGVNKYIEVSNDEFSVYSYTLTNTKYVAPSTGGPSSGSVSSNRKPVVNTSAK